MIESLVNFFSNIPDAVSLILISMLPIVELRGGIIAAKLMGVALFKAFPICVIGNMLPIPLILLFLNHIFNWMRRFKWCEKVLDFLDRKADKNREKVEKYKMLGLFILVAIPLPGTGAWTGSLVANALNIPFRKAFPTIFAGVVGAAVIMSLVSYAIPGLFGFFKGVKTEKNEHSGF